MPRRAAAVPSSEPPSEPNAEHDHPRSSQLNFSEPLSWRAGKAIPVADLLRRLNAFSSELRDLEQEVIDRSSLTKPAQELVSSNILNHKDRGVKALAACCIVDILRLCAPEAPLSQIQLKDFFTLFIGHIVPVIANTSDPYHTSHAYVLSSLFELKSITLLLDVPKANELVHHLFSACFDALASATDTLSKAVEFHITGLLECIIDECSSLPAATVDTILAQFLRHDASFSLYPQEAKTAVTKQPKQSRLVLSTISPAYNVAKNICNTCADRMSRYISHYFSAVILNATSSSNNRHGADEDSLIESKAISQDDLRDLRQAHRLLKELWRASPEVVQNVIPQIEAEFNADNEDLRNLAVECIGQLIAGTQSQSEDAVSAVNPLLWPQPKVNFKISNTEAIDEASRSASLFTKHHGSTFKMFLSRGNDKSPIVRATWVRLLGQLINLSPAVLGITDNEQTNLLELFSQALVDADDRVRISALEAIGALAIHTIVDKLGMLGSMSDENSILRRIAQRVKDKKPTVGAVAMPLVAKMWCAATTSLAEQDSKVVSAIGSSASMIFEAYYTNDAEIQLQIDRALFDILVPIGYPSVRKPASGDAIQNGPSQDDQTDLKEGQAAQLRVRRLLELMISLDEKAKKVLMMLVSRSAKYQTYMDALLKCLEEYNGGVTDSKDKDQLRELRKKMNGLIEMFAKLFPTPIKASEDFHKFAKLHDRRCYKLIKYCITADSDYERIRKSLREIRKRLEASSLGQGSTTETTMLLIQRCSHLFFNKGHVIPIIEASRDDDKKYSESAHEVLKAMSTNAPQIMQTHVGELCQSMASNENSESRSNDLKACAMLAKRMPTEFPKDRKLLPVLSKIAMTAEPAELAKYAVSIIAAVAERRDVHLKNLLRQCTEDFTYGSEYYLAKLACLSQLMRLASMGLNNEECDQVTDVAIRHVLQHHENVQEESGGSTWQADPDEHLQAKLWALKILVNRVRGYEDPSSIRDVAEPVYALLNKLIRDDGQLSAEHPSTAAHASVLRAEAAKLLLKLSTHSHFDSLLSPSAFNRLAIITQDPVHQVRKLFLEKLMQYIVAGRLSSRFYVLVFMTAFEPSERLRMACFTWLSARARSMSQHKRTTVEMSAARLISVLAHHPDFSTEDVDDAVTYLMWYLKTVATEDNVSLIHHIMQRVKGVQDGIDSSSSNNLYFLADLAQLVIRNYVDAKDWTLQAYDGKVNLPYGIFQPMPNHTEAQRVAEHNYLPSGTSAKVEELVHARLKTTSKKRKSEGDHAASRTNKKRVQSGRTKPRKKRTSNDKADDKAATRAAADRRKSTRLAEVSDKPSYAESQSSEDEDHEMQEAQGNVQSDIAPERESSLGPRDASELHEEDTDSSEKENKAAHRSEKARNTVATAPRRSKRALR